MVYCRGATPLDYRLLPRHIVLVRHAESEGNVDNTAYTYLPDPKVPLTHKGWEQAMAAGEKIRSKLEEDADGDPIKMYFYMSPYVRSRQTYEGLVQAFKDEEIAGVQEEVQLREQDFGNFQVICIYLVYSLYLPVFVLALVYKIKSLCLLLGM